MGRDDDLRVLRDRDIVSIHAPAWGATRHPPTHRSPARGFNPRARVGRDIECEIGRNREHVSIHAPAWGATRCKHRSGTKGEFEFQSTRPRGARLPYPPSSMTNRRGFNPRARVGRDGPVMIGEQPTRPVSIHAPAWGATLWPRRNHRAAVSIHAPAWGATMPLCRATMQMFQSTRPRGARR